MDPAIAFRAISGQGGNIMKRNDFLQNILLIILSALLAACIVNLACIGALPVTYTSHAQVQLRGDALFVSDIREFAGYIENDESLRNKVMEVRGEAGAPGSAGKTYHVTATAIPDTGIIDIFVRSGDPYISHDIAETIVSASYSDYPASHAGIFVHLVKAADVADTPNPRPVYGYTITGAVLGAAFGALLAFFAVRGEREKRRRRKTSDPRFASIEEQDEQAYDALFAEDNEDVDPEMRELYKVTKRAEASRGQEDRMSREAEAAYLEAMEIEATAADDEDTADQKTDPDTEAEGGDQYEE